MKSTLDKIFNPFSLLIINIVIVLLAELVGGGELFFDLGLIHVIAVLFIILTVARISAHYYTFDPILEKFLHASLAALAVFSVSHIFEFVSAVVFNVYHDSTFASVINFYLISILILIIGADMFLKIYFNTTTRLKMLLSSLIAALFILTLMFLISGELVSLEPDSWIPFAYAFALFCVGSFGIFKALQIKRIVSIMRGFVNYLTAGILLIILAALFNIFYEFLEHYLGIADHQIIYFSHFAFYAALSVMFLAFGKLSYLGEFYEDVKKLQKS